MYNPMNNWGSKRLSCRWSKTYVVRTWRLSSRSRSCSIRGIGSRRIKQNWIMRWMLWRRSLCPSFSKLQAKCSKVWYLWDLVSCSLCRATRIQWISINIYIYIIVLRYSTYSSWVSVPSSLWIIWRDYTKPRVRLTIILLWRLDKVYEQHHERHRHNHHPACVHYIHYCG